MSKRVLLADDHAERAEPVREALVTAGYTVVPAATWAECFQAADEELPDLIVLDAQMPVLDGLATLRILREYPDTKALPIIMLSDSSGELETRRAWAAAADMYLTRPVSPLAVVAAANWLLRCSSRWPSG
jgi:DNA-binding response OmpR family regulator